MYITKRMWTSQYEHFSLWWLATYGNVNCAVALSNCSKCSRAYVECSFDDPDEVFRSRSGIFYIHTNFFKLFLSKCSFWLTECNFVKSAGNFWFKIQNCCTQIPNKFYFFFSFFRNVPVDRWNEVLTTLSQFLWSSKSKKFLLKVRKVLCFSYFFRNVLDPYKAVLTNLPKNCCSKSTEICCLMNFFLKVLPQNDSLDMRNWTVEVISQKSSKIPIF